MLHIEALRSEIQHKDSIKYEQLKRHYRKVDYMITDMEMSLS